MYRSLHKIKTHYDNEIEFAVDTIAICDICKKSKDTAAQIKVLNIEVYYHEGGAISFDVCPECLRGMAEQVERPICKVCKMSPTIEDRDLCAECAAPVDEALANPLTEEQKLFQAGLHSYVKDIDEKGDHTN